VAELLAGAWRSAPPLPVNSEEELAGISTLLMKSGAASLSWNKIRNSELQSTRAGRELRQVYRLQSLQALLHERSLKAIISLLRSYGAEPVVVKGWAIARRYPEPGLRPYTDLDLCVLSDHYANAQKALQSGEALGCLVDLHKGFGKFYDREAEDIFARSRLVKLDDIEARVLSDEDHLRFLCMHLLRHGAARPFWLSDIAVLLEGRNDDFDWNRCLGGSARQADWVACAIGLAHQLLEANIDGTPVADRARKLPEWLVTTVLKEWGLPYQMPAQITYYLRHPGKLFRKGLKELAQHWPNPIEATMTLKGPFNEMPRLPFQIGHLISRTAALVADMPKHLRPLKS
jgi:hypothetical protein